MSGEVVSEKVVEESPVKKFLNLLERLREATEYDARLVFFKVLDVIENNLNAKTVFVKDITKDIFAYKVFNESINFYLRNHLVIKFAVGVGVVRDDQYLYCDIFSLDER